MSPTPKSQMKDSRVELIPPHTIADILDEGRLAVRGDHALHAEMFGAEHG